MLHSPPENDAAEQATRVMATLEAIEAMTDAALPEEPIVSPDFVRDAMEGHLIGTNLLHALLAKLREGHTQVVYGILLVPVPEMASRGFGGTLADRWRPLFLAVEGIRANTLNALSHVAPEFREPALMIVKLSRPDLLDGYGSAPRGRTRRAHR